MLAMMMVKMTLLVKMAMKVNTMILVDTKARKGKINNLGTQKVMKLAFMIMLVITEMMMNTNK